MSSQEKDKKELGMRPGITRRDFLNTTLLGAGGALLAAASPLAVTGCLSRGGGPRKDPWWGYGAVGDYARSPGNSRRSMEAAHRLRDGVYDGQELQGEDTGEVYDMVIVGGGMSGLGAAHYFHKHAGDGRRCLLLDNHAIFGGEAKRNEFVVDGERLMGPQGSNDFGVPSRGSRSLSGRIFDDLNIPREYDFREWDESLKPLGFGLDNYAHMTGVVESKVDIGYWFVPGGADAADEGNGSGFWRTNIWRRDLENAPWPEELKRDMLRWRYHRWEDRGEDFGRMLDSMSYRDLLEKELELPHEVTEYIAPVIGLINGASPDAVSAYAASQVGMPGTGRPRGRDASLPLSFPGGNTAFARYFVKGMIPEAIEGGHTFGDITNGKVRFEALDREEAPLRLRMGATVVRVEHQGEPGAADRVWITYEKDGKVRRVQARGVAMASGGWVNKHILRDLPPEMQQAYESFQYAPAMVANVALTNWRFLYDLGITAAQWNDGSFGFSCNIRRPMTAGGYRPPLHPDRPTVLTFYMGFGSPGVPLARQMSEGRWKLFGTTFFDFEKELRRQMLEQFGAHGFDPAKDIAGIVLNRWGHARLVQPPGFYFGGEDGPSPREVVENGYGRVAIGHSELNGHQNWSGGVAQGYRAAEQVLGML